MMSHVSSRLPVAMFIALVAAAAVQAQPTSAPKLIQASDLATLKANVGQDILLEGVVTKAEWSKTGKVMNVEFKGADRSKFVAIAFDRVRERLDKAFVGDAAKALTGAKIRIRGPLSTYDGPVEAMKELMQVIISQPSQVTIVEPAAGTVAP